MENEHTETTVPLRSESNTAHQQGHEPNIGPYSLENPTVCVNCGKLLTGGMFDEPCNSEPVRTDYLSMCYELGQAAGRIIPRKWSFDKDFQLYALMRFAGRIGFWGAAEHIRDDLLKRGVAERD